MRHPAAWFCGDKQSERARTLRRAYPVHMYVGRNGTGKSLCAVYDTLPDLDAGRPVLSTVRLLDYRNPRLCDDAACDSPDHATHMAAHPAYVPFTTWPQLLDLREGVVLMDEVTGVADSNEGSALPAAVANELAQLRRAGVVMRLTGLNFIRAHKRIREATLAVTRCRSLFAAPAVDEDGNAKMWRQRRMSLWHTYDAQSLPVDDHTEHAYDTADLLVSGRHWIPDSPAIRAYDTYDFVSRVGTVSDAGRCATCGGTRRAAECSCSDYQESKGQRRPPARRARSAEDRRTELSLAPLMPAQETPTVCAHG